MFRNQGFTGFQARQARVRFNPGTKAHGPAPELWELLVTGWGGMAPVDSRVVRIPNTNVWEGYPDWSHMVDIDSWDGSDFFIVWPFAFTRIVTDRVAKFIKEHKLTGARLIRPERYTELYRNLKLHQVTPMRLRDHYPEDRAREIGEPLGIY